MAAALAGGGAVRENVGGADRITRALLEPALIGLGLTRLGARRGSPLGLLSLVGGALIAETAITRVCPLSGVPGVDSAPAPTFTQRRRRLSIRAPIRAQEPA
jgi:hypothetical protein